MAFSARRDRPLPVTVPLPDPVGLRKSLPVARGAAWVHPRFRAMAPPVVVIGMHRSGTSLVAGMLAMLGVYMGPDVGLPEPAGWRKREEDSGLFTTGYAEARDFYLLNSLLLARSGATWNNVRPFLERRRKAEFAGMSLMILQAATAGQLRTSFLSGWRGPHDAPWGWKDPRTSLTLPYWLRLFPSARVIHVRRDPEAVLDSLHRRSVQPAEPPAPVRLPLSFRLLWHLSSPGCLRESLLRLLRRETVAPAPPDPCADRQYCRRLIEDYLGECLRYRETVERYTEVWYEDVLARPLAAAARLAEIAGCEGDDAGIRRATAIVRIPPNFKARSRRLTPLYRREHALDRAPVYRPFLRRGGELGRRDLEPAYAS